MTPATFRSAMILAVAGLLLAGLPHARVIAENELAAEPSQEILRPRFRVAVHNGNEYAIRDCLTNAIEAANSENLDGFCQCFAGSSRTMIRKQAAIRFVQHDVSMELIDTQVIKAGKRTGEVAVRYRLVLSEDRFDVVSLVAVKQEDGYWRIASEQIQSYEQQSPRMCSPSRYACLGATCHVAAR